MAHLLDEPLSALLDVPPTGPVPPEVAAFVARVATLAFTTASAAPRAATARALAVNSPQRLLGAFSDLLTASGSAGHPRVAGLPAADPLVESIARGRRALAEALEASGGVWRADEAQRRLGVSRTALHHWRSDGRVLALRLAGTFVYPVAQFAPAATDLEPPRPYPAITDVLAAVGDRMTPEELAGLLATPQPALARRGGADAGGPRTGFRAIADGDGALVAALVRHVVSSPDAEAQADAAAHAPDDGSSAGDAPRAAA